jgi:hypothetical protein
MKILSLTLLLAGLTFTSLAGADQPKMHEALASLEQARQAMQQASDDKGGHRLRAIRAIDMAIRETRAGIEYDRRYHSPGEGKR